MKTKLILAGILACIGMSAQAQNSKVEEPKGKAIVQVFGNFHTGFGSENDNRGFELERTYLGYEYNLGKGLTVKGVMDIGKSSDVSDYQRIAYIKNAMVQWKTGKLTLSGGLISTTQFNFQEKFWGYRYVMKSFQDQYKFGNSADLGISAAYKLADWITADAIIVNGEGYKKIQQESMDIACYCHEQIGKMKCFTNYAKTLDNPLFIWYMNPEYDKTAKWTLYDLQAVLQQSGWMVPAYTMPKDIEDLVVMRVVVRQGLTRDMADMLLTDIRNAVAEFDKLKYPTTSRLAYEK